MATRGRTTALPQATHLAWYKLSTYSLETPVVLRALTRIVDMLVPLVPLYAREDVLVVRADVLLKVSRVRDVKDAAKDVEARGHVVRYAAKNDLL